MTEAAATPSSERDDVEAFLPLGTPIFHILLTLGEKTLHGYAIQQRFEQETTGGRILPGTLYSSLSKMTGWGLVEEVDPPANPACEDDGAGRADARRRYYRVTALGAAVAAAEADRMERLVAFARRQAFLPGR